MVDVFFSKVLFFHQVRLVFWSNTEIIVSSRGILAGVCRSHDALFLVELEQGIASVATTKAIAHREGVFEGQIDLNDPIRVVVLCDNVALGDHLRLCVLNDLIAI